MLIITVTEIGELLSEKKVKPTHSRISIYMYLFENRIHPSVETIYNSLLPENPYMSKTTVYNTLREFADKGIIQELKIADGKSIFDADVSEHGHFICENCKEVYDFKIHGIDAEELPNFLIKKRKVYAQGICPNCRQNNK